MGSPQIARALGALAALLVTIAVLVAIGPVVPGPASWRPDQLRDWIDDVGAAGAFFSLARIGALLAAVYLLLATMTVVLAHRTSRTAAVRMAERAVPHLVSRWVVGVIGTGLGVASLTAASTGPVSAEGLRHHSPVAALGDADDVATSTDDGTATMRLVADPDPDPDATATMGLVADPDATATMRLAVPESARQERPAEDGAGTPRPEHWRIEPGEHLWRVAEATLQELADGPPTDQQIARYLDRLIDHNRDRLVDPGNPDLVYPGQEFELPPIG